MRIAVVLLTLPLLTTSVSAAELQGAVRTDNALRQERKLVDESAFADINIAPAPQRASAPNHILQAQQLQQYTPSRQEPLQGRAGDNQGYLSQPGQQQTYQGYLPSTQSSWARTHYRTPIEHAGGGYHLPLMHPPYALDICAPGRADVVAASLAIGLLSSMAKHRHNHHINRSGD
jgi:hypothetical protein